MPGEFAGQQYRCRYGAGTRHQRYGEREDRDAMNVVLGDGALRGVLMALLASFEDHLEGDPEQQQSAGDPERRKRDAEQLRGSPCRQCAKTNKYAERDDAWRAMRHLPALRPVHAGRDRQEQAAPGPGGSMVTNSVTMALYEQIEIHKSAYQASKLAGRKWPIGQRLICRKQRGAIVGFAPETGAAVIRFFKRPFR